MAVHTTVLGSMVITGADARTFERKVTHGRTNEAAKKSAETGKKLAESFHKKGYVAFKLARPR